MGQMGLSKNLNNLSEISRSGPAFIILWKFATTFDRLSRLNLNIQDRFLKLHLNTKILLKKKSWVKVCMQIGFEMISKTPSLQIHHLYCSMMTFNPLVGFLLNIMTCNLLVGLLLNMMICSLLAGLLPNMMICSLLVVLLPNMMTCCLLVGLLPNMMTCSLLTGLLPYVMTCSFLVQCRFVT